MTSYRIKTCVLIVMHIILALLGSVSATTYYVVPTLSTACPEPGNDHESCLTLSHHARKSSNFDSNTTLILLPGNHSLEVEFSVRNIKNLTITSPENASDSDKVTINCNSQSARFTFENINVISMRGLELTGCVKNAITLEQFTVYDCNLQGHGRNGTGLGLYSVTSIYIVSSSFSFFTSKQAGGAALLAYSNAGKCNIVLNNTSVSDNTAITGRYSNGGAVQATNCNITLNNNCSFINNKAVGNYGASGGALWVTNWAFRSIDCAINLDNSEFINNTASSTGYSEGGAILARHCSVLKLTNSLFESNRVDGNSGASGGAVRASYSVSFNVVKDVIIDNSMFINNVAASMSLCTGGALSMSSGSQSNTIISNSIFIDNSCSVSYTKNEDIVTNAFGGGGYLISGRLSFVVIHNCSFCKNTANGGSSLGIGGALLSVESPNTTISDSEFIRNIARYSRSSTSDESGPTGVVISYNSNLFLSDCKFTENTVMGTLGAVLGLANCSLTSYGFLDFIENRVDDFVLIAMNSTMYFSGNTTISNNNGLALQAFLCPTVMFTGHTSIVNNTISNNEINQEVGTVTGIYSSLVFNGANNIMYNTAIRGGAISATQSTVSLLGNVTIAYNKAKASGGGIYAQASNVNFVSTNNKTLIENKGIEKGGAIHAIASILSALDNSKTYIVRNHAKRGGGVCLESNSKLYIFKNTPEEISNTLSSPEEWIRLEFRQNTADYGGAVYVTDDTNLATCSATPFSKTSTTLNECFIQGLAILNPINPSVVGNNRRQNLVNTYFFNNTAAKYGNSVYGGLLDRCKINPRADILFSRSSFQPSSSLSATSYILNITDLAVEDYTLTKAISSDAVRVCFCRDNQPDCSYQPEPVSVSKGQVFNLSLVAVDQLENTILKDTIIHGFVDLPAILGEGESIQQTNESGACTNLTYRILSSALEEQLSLYAEGPCMSAGLSLANINVSIKPCPVGFVADDHNMLCVCDPLLLDDEYIHNCSIDDGTVLRREGVWFNHSNNTGFILHAHCPFDYCVKSAVPVNLNVPSGSDAQCDFNRSGILCGSCREGFSLSLGTSHCKQCSNRWLALLIVFVIAGVALVAFILVCNLTVAVGTINGLIFYANILTTNRATFLPFETPNFFTVFIAWLNLDFGFVTCFYKGMDGYAKEWLQLVFPFYIILIVAMIIIACEYSTRIARIFTKMNPVATLATLILLSYTKSLRVIIAAFSSATLEYPNGSDEKVWLIDGNICYLELRHAFLFVVAAFILLVGIVYTLFLFCYQWLLHYSYNRTLRWIRSARFYPFMDAYHAPYNNKFHYWTGLLLFLRTFLYIIATSTASLDPRINLLSISCTLLVFLLFKIVQYRSIYKSWLLDILEILFIFNLLVFSVASLYNRETGRNQDALAYTSTSIAFIIFLIILLYHVYAFVLPKKLRNKLDSIKCRKAPTDDDDAYNVLPAQENKCTTSEVDPIPPIPKTLTEVEALYKVSQKEENFDHNNRPNQSFHISNENPAPTSGRKIECRVEIELDSNNDQNSFSMVANGVACEHKSPTLPITRGDFFANPYVAYEDQRGLERETEINEIIEITQ